MVSSLNSMYIHTEMSTDMFPYYVNLSYPIYLSLKWM